MYIYTCNHLGALTYQRAADLEPMRVGVLFYLLLLTHFGENKYTYKYRAWQPVDSPPLNIHIYLYIFKKGDESYIYIYKRFFLSKEAKCYSSI